MKKILPILFVLIAGLQTLYAQIDSSTIWHKAIFDTTADFYEIRDIQDKYFRNHPDSNAHESGIRNEFYRWSRFWNHRVANDDGQVASIPKAIQNYQAIFQDIDNIL